MYIYFSNLHFFSCTHTIIRKHNILAELADGNEDMAGERMDMLISLSVTFVSAMVNLPLTADDAVDGRRKVSQQKERNQATRALTLV